MRLNDAVMGAVFILLAGAMIALTFSFPPFPGQKYGPSLFPRIIAGGIILFSALLAMRGMKERRERGGAWLAFDDWTRQPRRLASFALMLAVMAFYIIASEPLGFIVTAFLIQLVLFLWFGVKPVTSVVVAVLTTIMVQYFFGTLMRVPLPRGVLDSLL